MIQYLAVECESVAQSLSIDETSLAEGARFGASLQSFVLELEDDLLDLLKYQHRGQQRGWGVPPRAAVV